MGSRKAPCSRRRQTLVIILLIVLLFFLLQFFYMNRLSIFDRQASKMKILDNVFVEDILMDAERNKMRLKGGGGDAEASNHSQGGIDLAKVHHAPFGVHQSDAHKYIPDAEGMFQCLSTEEKIPYSFVNDDYCDCSDETDEPGTSACPDSRFFCRYQLAADEAQVIPSSRVNDGICDCCDGSDEWQGNLVPDNIRVVDTVERLRRPALHAPCDNVCRQVEHIRDDHRRINVQGKSLKAQYIMAALNVPNKEKFGPQGVFYKLSQSCFKFHSGEYEYKICPFVSATQQKFPEAAISLGQGGTWQLGGGVSNVLTMVGGDGRFCPGTPRTTKISFLCGLEDVILQVREEEKCLYRVKFSTPAAC